MVETETGKEKGRASADRRKPPGLSAVWEAIPWFPCCYLGVGLLWVWSDLSCVNPPYPLPDGFFWVFSLFDGVSILLGAVIVALTRNGSQFSTLFSIPGIYLITTALMCLGPGILYASAILGHFSPSTMYLAAAIGGVGSTLSYVMWWEVLSCLGPVRATFCYSASIGLRVFLIWLLRDLPLVKLAACVSLVALAAMVSLWRARARLSEEELLGQSSTKSFAFPWSPAAVVATCSFSMALILALVGTDAGVNGNPGAALAAIIVVAGVAYKGEAFRFDLIWKIALACMVLAIVPFGMMDGGGTVSGIAASASYALCLTLIFAIMTNLVYRFAANAARMFSLAFIFNLGFAHLGQYVGIRLQAMFPDGGTLLVFAAGAAAVALFVASMLLVFRKNGLDTDWGIIIKRPVSEDLELVLEKTRLGVRCRELAREHDLTRREEEVLVLLARRQRPNQIAELMCIQASTVRTHVKHVYAKLGVHNLSELHNLIGIS